MLPFPFPHSFSLCWFLTHLISSVLILFRLLSVELSSQGVEYTMPVYLPGETRINRMWRCTANSNCHVAKKCSAWNTTRSFWSVTKKDPRRWETDRNCQFPCTCTYPAQQYHHEFCVLPNWFGDGGCTTMHLQLYQLPWDLSAFKGN